MKSLLLAGISGALFALSLPPHNLELLGWAALSFLLVAAVGRRPLESMGLGIVSALVCGWVETQWLPGMDRMYWAMIPFLLVAFVLGIMATVANAARKKCEGLHWSLLIAVLGVSLEWTTTYAPIPINIALCQYRNLSILPIVSVTGIWGVSFLLWFANAAIADALLVKRIRTPAIVVALVITAGATLFGPVALHSEEHRYTKHVTVAAIQDVNSEETDGLAPRTDQPDCDRDLMTKEAASHGTALVVWSEESLGSYFAPQNSKDPTRTTANRLGITLVAGYTDEARPLPHNCAMAIAPSGDVAGIIYKTHLFLGEGHLVQAGHKSAPLNVPFGKLGMEICFDTAFTDTTRHLTASGAQIIAMPNFDPPTHNGVLHNLHSAMLPFRAAENRVPFVRSDSNGLCQIIAPSGRILGESPLYCPDVLIRSVPLGDGRGTLFTRFGDWFAYLCVVFLLILTRKRGNKSVAGIISPSVS